MPINVDMNDEIAIVNVQKKPWLSDLKTDYQQ
jgi:hypothetical protein